MWQVWNAPIGRAQWLDVGKRVQFSGVDKKRFWLLDLYKGNTLYLHLQRSHKYIKRVAVKVKRGFPWFYRFNCFQQVKMRSCVTQHNCLFLFLRILLFIKQEPKPIVSSNTSYVYFIFVFLYSFYCYFRTIISSLYVLSPSLLLDDLWIPSNDLGIAVATASRHWKIISNP